MKKIVSIFIGVLISATFSLGQLDDCERTKVGVSVNIVDDSRNYEWLENDFGSRPNSAWNGYVANMLVQILSEYEPNITFFSIDAVSDDYHYIFRANLTLAIVDEEYSEQTGYYVHASLFANANCIPSRNWGGGGYLPSSHGEDRELKQAMKNLASKFWPMDRNILLHEKRHPSAPRKPELIIQIEKDYISPLDKESRKTMVYAKVYDCRGHLVCDKTGNGQPVLYQDKIDRLSLKNRCCEGGYHSGNFMVIITYKDCNNEGEYKLKKGLEAEKKTIRFKTCQLGGPIVAEEKELIIRGLELNIKPDRREIFIDEGTEIVITLNETDPDGNKYPVAGQELKVYHSGLVNGTLRPRGPYTTDENGEVLLDYRAGDRDSRIDITASFQPPEYPDKADNHSSIIVKPMEYDATLFLKKKVLKRTFSHMEKSYQTVPCQNNDMEDLEFTETIEGSAYLTLKSVGSFDMLAFNQRWETYEVTDIRISGFRLNSTSKKTIYHQSTGSNCASSTLEQVENRKKVLADRKLDRNRMGGSVVVAFDKDSNEALLILPVGTSIGYTYDEIYSMTATITGEHGTSTLADSDTKHKSDALNIEAVEDEQPYAQANSRSQQMKNYIESITGEDGEEILELVPLVPESNQSTVQQKIHPDLIVQFGDGKTHFGGKGRKPIKREIPYGFEHEERIFSWQMTRNKKIQ